MSYDQAHAQAVRQALAHRTDVEEKFMFQALVFMVDGKMCLGVGKDELMCRIDPAQHDAALEHTGVREMRRGAMRGYVFVELASLQTKAQFQHWIDLALDYNPRAKASPRKNADKGADGKTPKETPKGQKSPLRQTIEALPLTHTLRSALQAHSQASGQPLQERWMFQFLCFMLGGKLRLGVGKNGLLVRPAPARIPTLLRRKGVSQMLNGKTPMRGFLLVAHAQLQTTAQHRRWLDEARAYEP